MADLARRKNRWTSTTGYERGGFDIRFAPPGVGHGGRGAPAAPRKAGVTRRSGRSILSLPDQYTTMSWTGSEDPSHRAGVCAS